ncbi:MAG: hypothetical protein ACRC11_20030 [Xenococcaceae cyanobacterium]
MLIVHRSWGIGEARIREATIGVNEVLLKEAPASPILVAVRFPPNCIAPSSGNEHRIITFDECRDKAGFSEVSSEKFTPIRGQARRATCRVSTLIPIP